MSRFLPSSLPHRRVALCCCGFEVTWSFAVEFNAGVTWVIPGVQWGNKHWKHRCPAITNTSIPWTEAREGRQRNQSTCRPQEHASWSMEEEPECLHQQSLLCRERQQTASTQPSVPAVLRFMSQHPALCASCSVVYEPVPSPLCQLFCGFWGCSKHQNLSCHPQQGSNRVPGKFLTDTVTWELTRTSRSHWWCPYNRSVLQHYQAKL